MLRLRQKTKDPRMQAVRIPPGNEETQLYNTEEAVEDRMLHLQLEAH